MYAHGPGDTKLLNPEGAMCCLGQVELQLGLTIKDILSKTSPQRIHTYNILCENTGFYSEKYSPTRLAAKAMVINDKNKYNRAEREAKLVELFRNEGHTLQFVGQYVMAPPIHWRNSHSSMPSRGWRVRLGFKPAA